MNNMFNDKRRCELAGIENPNYKYGGCIRFYKLTVENFRLLLEEGYIDPDDCQNDSPTAKEFFEFMNDYSDFGIMAQGYVISPKREDCRVTIDGLEYVGATSEELREDFINMFRLADEFGCSNKGLYCWYD